MTLFLSRFQCIFETHIFPTHLNKKKEIKTNVSETNTLRWMCGVTLDRGELKINNIYIYIFIYNREFSDNGHSRENE